LFEYCHDRAVRRWFGPPASLRGRASRGVVGFSQGHAPLATLGRSHAIA